MVAMERLSALDAAFLSLEDDVAPLHVGSLLVLEGPAPDPVVLRAELDRAVAVAPAFRRRVQRMPGNLGRPVWVDDDGFRIEDHVHHAVLPAGDDRALRELVVSLMRDRLDVGRALWQMWQVDGLADGRWALVVKVHHTMADGFVGADLLRVLLSAADADDRHVRLPSPRLAVPTAADVVRRAAWWGVSLPYRAGRSLARVVAEPGEAAARVGAVRQGVRAVAVPDLPPSPVAGPLGPDRCWGWLTYGLADLGAAAHASGATVNDVLLAGLAGAYRRQLALAGELRDDTRLRAIVPVAMHDAVGRRTGNLDAAFFVVLPVHEPDPALRLADVTRQTREAKATGVATGTHAVVRLADHVPTPVLDRAARAYVRHGQRRVNVAASNVPGPSHQLRVAGRPLVEIVPWMPIALEVRTSCALLSYAGRAAVSVTTDAASVPDVDRLLADLGASLDELVLGALGGAAGT